MVETEEQQAVLAQIEKEAASLQLYKTQAKTTRNRLWELMSTAKDLRTSSYAIATAAGISQPRVMQIIKEVRDAQSVPEQPSSDAPGDPPTDPNGSGSTAGLGE